ncbi:hypothetical protein ACTOV4_10090 [Brucella sp. C7-11G]
MIFVTHEIQSQLDGETAQAHSLRRYLYRRVAGLQTLECSSGGQYISEDLAIAKAMPYRKIRQKGAAWCKWLGLDDSIHSDPLLQAYWTLSAPSDGSAEEPYFWQRQLKECTKGRLKALRTWRQAGADAMQRAAQQRIAPMSDAELAKSKVNPKFARKGTGSRPLKAAANAKPQRGRVREA